MNLKEAFFRDIRDCDAKLTHIESGGNDAVPGRIDELYGAADILSLQSAGRHRKILLALSAAGTLLTLFFLLYDEAELHGLILACGVLILSLFLIRRFANRMDCHRKYLQYRVLAESLRIQYYLYTAGIRMRVSEILPWSVKKGIPWIEEVLSELPMLPKEESFPIIDCWIRSQRRYHEDALRQAETKNRRDGRIALAVTVITIAAYIAALLFEVVIYGKAKSPANADLIRAVLKIVLGTMSAVMLFTGSYYGKMSLSNVIDDHKRMIALYDQAERDIARQGEKRELLLTLARECLNENSTWYAYQSKNKPDLVI